MKDQINAVYVKIFQKHFPDFKPEDVTALYDGNDHWVFVVKNKSFRFPKVPREIDPKRSKFFEQLAPVSPLPLPNISIHKDAKTGICYEINDYIMSCYGNNQSIFFLYCSAYNTGVWGRY